MHILVVVVEVGLEVGGRRVSVWGVRGWGRRKVIPLGSMDSEELLLFLM